MSRAIINDSRFPAPKSGHVNKVEVTPMIAVASSTYKTKGSLGDLGPMPMVPAA